MRKEISDERQSQFKMLTPGPVGCGAFRNAVCTHNPARDRIRAGNGKNEQ